MGLKYLSSKWVSREQIEDMSLSQICHKLRKLPQFSKKRELKHLAKSELEIETLAQMKSQLETKLQKLNPLSSQHLSQDQLGERIKALESVLNLEKRLASDRSKVTMAELDLKPVSANAFDIQNLLMKHCGVES